MRLKKQRRKQPSKQLRPRWRRCVHLVSPNRLSIAGLFSFSPPLSVCYQSEAPGLDTEPKKAAPSPMEAARKRNEATKAAEKAAEMRLQERAAAAVVEGASVSPAAAVVLADTKDEPVADTKDEPVSPTSQAKKKKPAYSSKVAKKSKKQLAAAKEIMVKIMKGELGMRVSIWKGQLEAAQEGTEAAGAEVEPRKVLRAM